MEDKGRILQNFPSFNTSNFTQFDPHTADKKKKKITVYLSTEDHGPQQVIKKDRSSILLRYLYQQLDKKKHEGMKHKINPGDSPKTGSNSPDDEPRRKILKPSHSRDDVTSTSSFSQKT